MTFAGLVLQTVLRLGEYLFIISQAYSYICILIGGLNIIVLVASCCTFQYGDFDSVNNQEARLANIHHVKLKTVLVIDGLMNKYISYDMFVFICLLSDVH